MIKSSTPKLEKPISDVESVAHEALFKRQIYWSVAPSLQGLHRSITVAFRNIYGEYQGFTKPSPDIRAVTFACNIGLWEDAETPNP